MYLRFSDFLRCACRQISELWNFSNREDILYVESNLHKLIFHMAGNLDRKYTMYEKLDSIEELLHDAGFCRIHKSCLVNLRYVEHVERYKAELLNGSSLAISKSRYIHTRDEWICYRGEI